ncbi:MAG: hypothetical protein QF637_11505 [Acidimicrobiales bacterium]|nr:hypothetical protein [Acidimicrobiales bacterium]
MCVVDVEGSCCCGDNRCEARVANQNNILEQSRTMLKKEGLFSRVMFAVTLVGGIGLLIDGDNRAFGVTHSMRI